ncbi:GNAT family N-acetyltransferase [Sphingobium sufflavum]|uniref:GNAT family N-acetyltransferase n=1 Tax=Sphingobium sufflavum TaxID=1129547 RepID=UPI001F3A2F49|nr:GNAT family N-acetyltransferase [Sphingobium sufflavum]MCE7797702.1 GNAT family N-acetyltransferase [Sphingobium sufflavum]
MKQEPVDHWTQAGATPAQGAAMPPASLSAPSPPPPADPVSPAPCPWAEANSFYEPAMLHAALAQFDPAGQVRRLDVTEDSGDGGEATLLARLPVAAATRHGRYPARHVANWVHPHCYYGAPLLRAGREEDGWRGLLAQLDAADWSGDFLHLRLVDGDGPAVRALAALCAAQGRTIVEIERYERALLRSPLSAEDYWTQNVRSKKRKELRRQQNRLAECGRIERRVLTDAADLSPWCDAFLALEALGWKGAEGTALTADPANARFFRQACADAFATGGLDMLRIDCDGRAIAMLVNFVGGGGGFSFKIANDPAFARYSPGVLVEMDNLARVLDDRRTPWMDSCAMPGHPMIDSLWAERRAIVQYRVALHRPGLRGLRGRVTRYAIDTIEALAARARHRRSA